VWGWWVTTGQQKMLHRPIHPYANSWRLPVKQLIRRACFHCPEVNPTLEIEANEMTSLQARDNSAEFR